MVGVKSLLLNVLIVVLPIFIYELILERHPMTKRRREILLGLLSSFSIIMCISFPFMASPGYLFDLRDIPLFLSFLYGGYPAGLIATATMYLYRLHFGGIGFYVALFAFPPAILVTAWFARRFSTFSRKKKYLFGIGIEFFRLMLKMIFTAWFIPYVPDFTLLTAASSIIGIFTMLFSIYIIEFFDDTRKLKLEMVHTEKLKVVSELAASIAHEVRNPMTTARGFAQLLKQDSSLTSAQLSYVSWIVSELDRAQGIITEYLSFARPEENEDNEIDVAKEILQVVNLLTPYAASSSVVLRQDIESSLWVAGNGAKIGQALLNIIKNAIEAMPTGGTVQVIAKCNGESAHIEIIDGGVGMSEAEMKQLGTPYFSTKANGTGLGLAMTYQVVKMMNGKIEAVSTKGKGTQFIIDLPMCRVEKQAVEESKTVFAR